MSLPKINQPIFNLYLPGIGKDIKYRPFTVKEEKLLLFAQSSDDKNDQMDAVKQLINNCCLSELDVNKLPAFDLELFFVHLRAKSVSNMVNIQIKEGDEAYDVEINLDEVGVFMDPDSSKNIMLDEDAKVGITMRYPSFEDIQKYADEENDTTTALRLITDLIESVFDAETVYPASDTSPEEMNAFIDSMNSDQMQKIKNFLDTIPYVYLDVEYEKDGETHTKRIRGMDNFFE